MHASLSESGPGVAYNILSITWASRKLQCSLSLPGAPQPHPNTHTHTTLTCLAHSVPIWDDLYEALTGSIFWHINRCSEKYLMTERRGQIEYPSLLNFHNTFLATGLLLLNSHRIRAWSTCLSHSMNKQLPHWVQEWVSAQEQTDQSLVPGAISFPLHPCLLQSADFLSLPEQETSITQTRAPVPPKAGGQENFVLPAPRLSGGAVRAASACVAAQPQCRASGRGWLLAAVGRGRGGGCTCRRGRCVTDPWGAALGSASLWSLRLAPSQLVPSAGFGWVRGWERPLREGGVRTPTE